MLVDPMSSLNAQPQMPTPTEPGTYWWWDEASERTKGPRCLRVFLGRNPHDGRTRLRTVVYAAGCPPLLIDASALGGTWGERIPDNPTLKALKELAAKSPIFHGGGEYDEPECVYCGGGPPRLAAPVDHAPDCPWVRAQPKEETAVPHKDSGKRCAARHIAPDGTFLPPGIWCDVCRRYIQPGDMSNECPGPEHVQPKETAVRHTPGFPNSSERTLLYGPDGLITKALKRKETAVPDVTIPTPKEAQEGRDARAAEEIWCAIRRLRQDILQATPEPDGRVLIDARPALLEGKSWPRPAFRAKLDALLDAAGWNTAWRGAHADRMPNTLVLTPKKD